MSVKHFPAVFLKPLFLILIFLFILPLSAMSADDMTDFLPPLSCAADWKIEGKLTLYDRNTLSDRINGEAELYIPYGFDQMAAARYVSGKISNAGIDVEIYRMGSLLDAFGMYANYRQKDGSAIDAGAESNLSGSQIYFYQGRYFVHIQLTGMDNVPREIMAECAKNVSSRLHADKMRPSNLSAFDLKELIKGTERYLPQSLLGYDFFNRGIMADAAIEGTDLQIFLLTGTTIESASAAFDRYASQLGQVKIESVKNNATFLEGIDPLYGSVMLLKKGGCLAGALKFKAKKETIRALLNTVCR